MKSKKTKDKVQRIRDRGKSTKYKEQMKPDKGQSYCLTIYWGCSLEEYLDLFEKI